MEPSAEEVVGLAAAITHVDQLAELLGILAACEAVVAFVIANHASAELRRRNTKKKMKNTTTTQVLFQTHTLVLLHTFAAAPLLPFLAATKENVSHFVFFVCVFVFVFVVDLPSSILILHYQESRIKFGTHGHTWKILENLEMFLFLLSSLLSLSSLLEIYLQRFDVSTLKFSLNLCAGILYK